MVGYIVSIFLGLVDFSVFSKLSLFTIPLPLRYGMSFDFASFVPFVFLYILTSIETIGSVTYSRYLPIGPLAA
ncbi:MAG: solute carrier family 23 protein [candidate division WOR-3 bacterium]